MKDDVRYIIEYNKMNFGKYISFKIIGHDYVKVFDYGRGYYNEPDIEKDFVYNDIYYKKGVPIDNIDYTMSETINNYIVKLRLNKLKKI